MIALPLRNFFIPDDELARLPDALIAQLSREARKRAKALQRLPFTDDMIQMIDDLARSGT